MVPARPHKPNDVGSNPTSAILCYSSIAQSVEHAAVNRAVVGSSPTRGVLADEPKDSLSTDGELSNRIIEVP